jgi:hypothetical protein
MGPAFSTPYQERIKAATRSAEKQQAGSTEDKTAALKRFLALGGQSGSPSAKPGGQQNQPAPFGHAVGPQIHQAPLTSANGQDMPRTQDIMRMEDSLRRILKLDAGQGF